MDNYPIAFTLLASLIVSGGSSACGTSSDAVGDPIAADAADPNVANLDRYFPMAVGASWGYDVNTGGTVGAKVQTVLALEDLGGLKAGTMAYKVQSTKPSGKITLSWQEDTGTALIRHREQTFASDQTQETEELYTPSKLRLDESADHLVQGTSFEFVYEEAVEDLIAGGTTTLSKTETWTVEATDVSVVVPAGTFTCIQLRKFNAATNSDKRYWFAKGVGKVREESASQSEELTTYLLP